MKKRETKIEFARTVCAVVRDGSPDLYNAPALRVVPIEESKERGWAHYYDGKTACPAGHVAARYVTNPSACVDCRRLGDGKLPIYPKTEFVDELTGNPVYVPPVASDRFDWTDDKKKQLLRAWVNTRNFLKACEVIGAQPADALTLLRTDPVFKADYEAAEQDVALVQLWATEGAAANGDTRTALAMASNKFPQFGAKTGLAGRPAVNSEQVRAELTQLLSAIDRSIAQSERLESIASATGPQTVGVPDTAAASPAAGAVEEPALLASSHDHSDLVS